MCVPSYCDIFVLINTKEWEYCVLGLSSGFYMLVIAVIFIIRFWCKWLVYKGVIMLQKDADKFLAKLLN